MLNLWIYIFKASCFFFLCEELHSAFQSMVDVTGLGEEREGILSYEGTDRQTAMLCVIKENRAKICSESSTLSSWSDLGLIFLSRFFFFFCDKLATRHFVSYQHIKYLISVQLSGTMKNNNKKILPALYHGLKWLTSSSLFFTLFGWVFYHYRSKKYMNGLMRFQAVNSLSKNSII